MGISIWTTSTNIQNHNKKKRFLSVYLTLRRSEQEKSLFSARRTCDDDDSWIHIPTDPFTSQAAL
jgi:hypothetical protein